MKKTYSTEHDAYYDEETNEWLEPVCGDPNCEYCKRRPERPMKEEKKTTTELFVELRDCTRKLERLEQFKAHSIIIEEEKKKFNSILKELMQYMSPAIIEREMQTKWLNRKWKGAPEE